jgi:hypothetical protein
MMWHRDHRFEKEIADILRIKIPASSHHLGGDMSLPGTSVFVSKISNLGDHGSSKKDVLTLDVSVDDPWTTQCVQVLQPWYKE